MAAMPADRSYRPPKASTRRTYVVSVRDQDGPAMVHEVRTGRKARLRSLREITAQIEGWLRETKPPGRGKADPERKG